MPSFPFTWHGAKPGKPDWSSASRSLAVQISEKTPGAPEITDIYIAASAYWESLGLELPKLTGSRRWFRVMDTMLDSPQDISEEGKEPSLGDQNTYEIGPRTVVVLIGKQTSGSMAKST